MKKDARRARRGEIIEAAYAVLADKGYAGTSMLAVASKARASNETLYNWFGSKQGLFAAMVEDNAGAAAAILEGQLDGSGGHDGGDDAAAVLARLGPALLRLVTSPRAIALNRAAAADAGETGVLGRTLARSGRERIVPLLERLFERARGSGLRLGPDGTLGPAEAAELYVSLLIGDLQIRCVIGARQAPGEAEIAGRSRRAAAIVLGCD